MRVTYRFHVAAVCPVNGGHDTYKATLERDTPILVEEMKAIVAVFASERVLQEDLTVQLAERLGGIVETTGWHSGVQVTCRA